METKTNDSGIQFGTTTTNAGTAWGASTGTTSNISNWSYPELIKTEEIGESIEFIYKQYLTYSTGWFYPPPQQERVFKIVFSCVDGKWSKSEPIYGKIIPVQDEDYEFDI